MGKTTFLLENREFLQCFNTIADDKNPGFQIFGNDITFTYCDIGLSANDYITPLNIRKL